MFRYVSAEKRKQRRDCEGFLHTSRRQWTDHLARLTVIKHTFDDGPFGTGDSDNAGEGPSYY
jgi:hypothetical protein